MGCMGAIRLVTLLGFLQTAMALGQESPVVPPEEQAQHSLYFSGTITTVEVDKLTVVRNLIGKEPTTRVFLLTNETRMEGKLRPKARVTVRFITGDDGDRALYILVRATPLKK